MKSNIAVIGPLCALLSGTVLATDTSYVIALSGGPAWTNSGHAQTFFLQPDVENTYKADNKYRDLFEGEIFLGFQRQINPAFAWQLGVAGAASTNARFSGDIWEDANPNFNDFDYKYNVLHRHLAVKGKVLGPVCWLLQPYISASAGVGFNRAHDFTLTPKIAGVGPEFAFESNDNRSFTYNLGIGIQTEYEGWVTGIGYQFEDWGKSDLASAPGQTVNGGLTLNHVYIHQLQFTIGYVGQNETGSF